MPDLETSEKFLYNINMTCDSWRALEGYWGLAQYDTRGRILDGVSFLIQYWSESKRTVAYLVNQNDTEQKHLVKFFRLRTDIYCESRKTFTRSAGLASRRIIQWQDKMGIEYRPKWIRTYKYTRPVVILNCPLTTRFCASIQNSMR